MHLLNFYQRHSLHKLSSHPDLNHFEFSVWLHTIARSLVSVFIPILMLKIGYSIQSVLLYYLLFNLLDVPFNFVAHFLVKKFGAIKIMIVGTLFTIGYFFILNSLGPNNFHTLVLLAIFAAVYDTTYWVSHIYIFYEANLKEHLESGKSVGSLQVVRRLGELLGPGIGALVLIFFDESLLIYASIIIFLFSLIPLFKLKHIDNIPKKHNHSFLKFFSTPGSKKSYFSKGFWGIQSSIESIIWPLYIYTVYETVGSVALIPIFASLSTLIFAKLIGNLSDKYSVKMILAGCVFVFVVWALRLNVEHPVFYYSSTLLVGIFSLLVNIPLDNYMVDISKKSDTLLSSTYRNAFAMAGNIPLFLVLYFSTYVFETGYYIAIFSVIVVFMLSKVLKYKP